MRMYHGSPFQGIEVSKAKLLFYTPSLEVAKQYSKSMVAFTGKGPTGSTPGATIYEVDLHGLVTFDLRKQAHQQAYLKLREKYNASQNDPDYFLPSLKSEGFLMRKTGLPSYGTSNILFPLLRQLGFNSLWIDEGSQGISLAVFSEGHANLVKESKI